MLRRTLRPAPAADPRTLVRRLSFDLLGLPPTAAQVEAFVVDPSAAAWDRLVEELLASPHHAERLTTFWFDLVRFADTTGIHADNRWNILWTCCCLISIGHKTRAGNKCSSEN